MKKRSILFTVTAIILITATFAMVGTGCKKSTEKETEADAPQKVSDQTIAQTDDKLAIDPSAGEYVAPVTTQAQPSSGIAIPGWGYISLPAGETKVTVDLPNPDANEGKYYLTFKIQLKDSGEVLYTSGLVPPGQTIQSITLSRALDAGEYDAIIHVQPYKMDEAQTPTNNADMETVLVVK